MWIIRVGLAIILPHPDLTSFRGQLYGAADLQTNEWTDGIASVMVRHCSNPNEEETTVAHEHVKWVYFDGPVDAIWIENMNTVLDDNKKLCLNSGEIIQLSDTMRIMFEVEDGLGRIVALYYHSSTLYQIC